MDGRRGAAGRLHNACIELFEPKSLYELKSVPYPRFDDNEKQVDRFWELEHIVFLQVVTTCNYVFFGEVIFVNHG